MNVDEISEWQWRIERGRWRCDLMGYDAPRITNMAGFVVCRAESEETAEYIVGLHNARFTPCLACGEHHDSLMTPCKSESKRAADT